MEKPDEGYDSTGEVSSLLIVVALFSNVVDCRPSQESGLLINQSKKRKVPIFIKRREAGGGADGGRGTRAGGNDFTEKRCFFFTKGDSDAVLTQS